MGSSAAVHPATPSSSKDGSSRRRVHAISAAAMREMKALSLMSLVRRLRVSLPLLLLSFTILVSCHTLAQVQQVAVDGEDVLPRVLLQVWLPCSHIFGPLMLMALRPCDRMGTLWAAIVFAAICAYAIGNQIYYWPTAAHGFNTTRGVLLLLCEICDSQNSSSQPALTDFLLDVATSWTCRIPPPNLLL